MAKMGYSTHPRHAGTQYEKVVPEIVHGGQTVKRLDPHRQLISVSLGTVLKQTKYLSGVNF
jgi:hypothetical protein